MIMSRPLRCIVIDDEELARRRMQDLLDASSKDVDILALCESGKQGLLAVKEHKPDLVFLDIQMPGLDGFDVLELLPEPRPWIIFVTAFDQYAIEAFDHFALDYLTKPVRVDRLKKSLDRVTSMMDISNQNEAVHKLVERRRAEMDTIPVRQKDSFKMLSPDEVYFFEAEEKLVYAHTQDNRYRIDRTLSELEDQLNDRQFIRVHRAFIVNRTAIDEISPWFSGSYQIRMKNGTSVPVSRRQRSKLKETLNI